MLTCNSRKRSAIRREGAVLPLVAVLLVPLILILSLMAEVAWINYCRFESQSAADLASKSALAALYDNQEELNKAAIRNAKSLGSSVFNQNSRLEGCSEKQLDFGLVVKTSGEFQELRRSRQFRNITSAKFDFKEQNYKPLLGNLIASRPINLRSSSVSETASVEIVMCIDASRSMCYNSVKGSKFPRGATGIHFPPVPGSRWFVLLDAVRTHFDNTLSLDNKARLGLVTFGGGMVSRRTLSPLDKDLARTELELGLYSKRATEIERELDSYAELPALGFGTSIFDGLDQSIAVLDRSTRPARRVIVLFADGAQSKALNRPDPVELAKEAKQQGILIMTIGYSVGANARLESIAEATNGENFNVNSPEELNAAFLQISKLLKVRLTQ